VIPRALAAVFALEALFFMAVATIALDMRAHYRVQDLGGVNVRGYRGPIMNRRRPNEIRVALVGGDFAYGWGVAAAETMPFSVRRIVELNANRIGARESVVTSVNLAARGLDVPGYGSWIDRFAYLKPDVLCVLPDPSPHAASDGRFLPDRRSRVFQRFGYSPILPLVLHEKAQLAHSAALDAAAGVLERLDLAAPVEVRSTQHADDGLENAVKAALRVARMGVVVVLPPDGGVAPPDPSRDRRLRVVDLAAVPAMHDMSLRLDGFAFSVAGHSRAADAVAPAVIELIGNHLRGAH